MNEKFVYNVLRKGDKAVHYTEKPFTEGEEVKQTVNWERRFDHMQQHSGQHLLSAIFENELKMKTISWWLGEHVSYVELGITRYCNFTFLNVSFTFRRAYCNRDTNK